LGYNKIEEETMEKLKAKAQHIWLMYREYIIGAVVGIVIGAIIF
jgi:F0F1-type ATP synthase assembly protein I